MKVGLCRMLAVATLLAATPSLRAIDAPLDRAKALYAEASFEEALEVIGGLGADAGQVPDALQFKVLCLLALGRSEEAQSAADMLVSTAPMFAPAPGDDLSPRFISLLTETRRRVVPAIAKRMFSEARDQFHAQNAVAARQRFEQVLGLANDAAWSDSAEAADLRTLASGFLDLLRPPAPAERPAPPQPAAVAAASPSPSPLPAPPTRAPAAARAPVPAVAAATVLQPAVAIAQPMPRWSPPDALSATLRFTGAVRIRIATDGHVVSAVMEVPAHPDYDRLLLEATRTWLYKPAMRNGEPVEVEKLVTFVLRAN